jgi:uncharacterized protein YndB with AHSA1/START domain
MAWWRGTTPIRSDRRFRFDSPVEDVWARMSQVDEYRAWWPWLRQFDGRALEEGAVWRCRVQPPLPYTVRFTLTLDEVAEREHVAATVAGDIAGSAAITLAARGTGCDVRLQSSLAPRHPGLRALAVVGRPLVRIGHDWVLGTGAKQFDGGAAPTVQGGAARRR